jgi:hypothetical protein
MCWSLAYKDKARYPALEVLCTHFELGEVSIGAHEVQLEVRNSSDIPGQLLGLNPSCGTNCCIRTRSSGRPRIAPGEIGRFPLIVEVFNIGRFESKTSAFVEGESIREIEIQVAGHAVAGPNHNKN